MFEQKKKKSGNGDAHSEREAYNRKMLRLIIALILLFIIACVLLIVVLMDHKGMSNFLQK